MLPNNVAVVFSFNAETLTAFHNFNWNTKGKERTSITFKFILFRLPYPEVRWYPRFSLRWKTISTIIAWRWWITSSCLMDTYGLQNWQTFWFREPKLKEILDRMVVVLPHYQSRQSDWFATKFIPVKLNDWSDLVLHR